MEHDTTVERSFLAVGFDKIVPSPSLCFLAAAGASASLIMPPQRSLAASRGQAKRIETLMAKIPERMNTLMAEIRALGHIPRHKRGAEDALSQRLYYAKRKRQLSESQLAELAEFQGSESRMDTLMAQIRALGHIPRRKRGSEDALSQR